MANVFTRLPHKSNGSLDKSVISDRILKALKSTEWVSTTGLYDATGHHTKREILHDVLKELLKSRQITMRTIRSKTNNCMAKTEFKLAKENHE